MACAGITVGAAYNCDDPLTPFVRQRLLIGNLSEATFTFSVTPGEENVITAIVMDQTKAMYAFEGVKTSISAQNEMVVQTLSNAYNHQCNLSVFDVSSAQKLNLQGMASVEQFCIVENSHDTSLANSVYEVYGQGRGMLPSEMIRIAADTETGGAYVITLITPDEGGKETTLPSSFFITDIATTDAAVEALLTPAV